MATRTCRVGLHGRNNVDFDEIDYQAISAAKIEAVKMMSQSKPKVFKRLKKENPNIEIITRLYDDRFGVYKHPTPQEFVKKQIPIIRALQPYCAKFEVHNEPNHIGRFEGWGQEDHHAKDFNQWFMRVYDLLKNTFPWASLGFPGLAIPHRDLEWIEICRPAVNRADWLGVHCFVGNTPVSLGDGTQKEIKDIQVGDHVITHTGQVKKVLKVSKRPYAGKLFTIRATGTFSVTCTPEHPFWMRRRTATRKYLQKKTKNTRVAGCRQDERRGLRVLSPNEKPLSC